MIDIRGLEKRKIMAALIRNAVCKTSHPALRPVVPPPFFRLAYVFFSLSLGLKSRHPGDVGVTMFGKGTRKILTQQGLLERFLNGLEVRCPEKVGAYRGIPICADLTGDTFNCVKYNEHYGPGEGERIVNAARRELWEAIYVEQNSRALEGQR